MRRSYLALQHLATGDLQRYISILEEWKPWS